MIDRIGGTGNEFFHQSQIQQTQLFHLQQQVIGQDMRENLMQRAMLDQMETPRPEITERTLNAAEFATELRETFGQLEEAAGELAPDRIFDNTVFEARTADVGETQEESQILQAEAQAGAERQAFDVEVEALAQAQVVETDTFEADAAAEEALDLEGEEALTITLTQDDEQQTFTIDIDEDTTIADVLEDVAAELGEAEEIGVTAEVIGEGEALEAGEALEEGEIALQVEAEEPDEAGAFTIEAEETEALRFETVREPEAAQVAIEGMEEETDFVVQGDTVILDEGRVELQLEAPGETTVEIGPDVETIREGIEDFARAFDQAQTFIAERETAEALDRLGERMMMAARQNEDALGDIGIDVEEDELVIREDMLEDMIAEDPEAVEDTLTDFAARTERIADDALTTPPSRFMGEPAEETEDPFGIDLEDFRQFDEMGRLTSPFGPQAGIFYDFVL